MPGLLDGMSLPLSVQAEELSVSNTSLSAILFKKSKTKLQIGEQ